MLTTDALDLLCVIVDYDREHGHGPAWSELLTLSGISESNGRDAVRTVRLVQNLQDKSGLLRIVNQPATSSAGWGGLLELTDRAHALELANAHQPGGFRTSLLAGIRSRRSPLAQRIPSC